MKVEINADSLVDAVSQNAKQLTRDFARQWFTEAQDNLLEAGDDLKYEVFPVVQTGTPPKWDGEKWTFSFEHIAAPFFEFGTEPHTIRADDGMLKFPWPDAPQEIKDRFRDQWDDPNHWLEEPEVLLKEVKHPGTPEIRWLRDARDTIKGEMK